MNIKMHFLHLHLDYFPDNFANLSAEHGGKFHLNVKKMERKRQGRWTLNMTEYCWALKWNCK